MNILCSRVPGGAVSVCSTHLGGPRFDCARRAGDGGGRSFSGGSAGGRQDDIPLGTPVLIPPATARGPQRPTCAVPVVADSTCPLPWSAAREAARNSGGIGLPAQASYVPDRRSTRPQGRRVVAAEQERPAFVIGSLRMWGGGTVSTTQHLASAAAPPGEKARLFRVGRRNHRHCTRAAQSGEQASDELDVLHPQCRGVGMCFACGV